jgi:ribosomal protein S27AE
MVTWKLRSCPRCGGDLFLDRDIYSWYEQCVQCGYVRDLKSIDEFDELEVEGGKKQATAGTRRRRR